MIARQIIEVEIPYRDGLIVTSAGGSQQLLKRYTGNLFPFMLYYARHIAECRLCYLPFFAIVQFQFPAWNFSLHFVAVRLSSVVSNVRAPYTQPVKIFGNFSSPFCTLAVDIHGKFYGDRPREPPPSGGLNARGVAKYSDFDIWNAVFPKRCKIGGKLVLITNRKSYMSFRSVPKSVTLNDLEC